MGLLTNKYTLIAILYLTSLVASGWLSYDYASTKVKYDWEQERVEMRDATIVAMTAINKQGILMSERIKELESISNVKSEKVRVETVEVEKEVIRYVKNYVAGTCPVDNDRLLIKNRSIATTNEFAEPTIN
jgi:translation initiation factor 6 (eIF-6)